MTAPPRIFDRRLHRLRLGRAAAGFEAADFLKRQAAEDLVDRLEAVNRRFAVAVDVCARRGEFAQALAASQASDKIGFLAQADICAAMLAGRAGPRLAADEERPPFAEASIDLIVSAVGLHWTNDLVGALIQIRRALKPDGLMLASLLGGATLTELRQALMEAELELAGGAGPRVSPFADARDVGGLLQRAGFALPVVDVDRTTVRYDHLFALLADLRAMGETNVLADRPAGPLTRAVLRRACEIYAERFGAGGRIAATFAIVTLTGWAPHPDQPRPLRPGSARTRLADALGAKEMPAGEAAPSQSQSRSQATRGASAGGMG
ncbi:MAG: methyltransferase domain-containing protein [Caulobacteraceae bacterium]